MTPTIIINADDFGFSPAVNSAIVRLAKDAGSRNLTSGVSFAASLMVNMPFAEDAAKHAAEHCPELPLALHFTLTSGPCCAGRSLLTDPGGMFAYGFLGLWRHGGNAEFIKAVKTELDAQLGKMQYLTEKYSLNWTGLDSHQHIHTLPDILPLVQTEAGKRHLRLRIPKESFGDWRRIRKRWTVWFPAGLMKRLILNRNCRKIKQTAGYFGILDTGRMDVLALTEIVRVIQSASVNREYEINIHPSDDITDTSGWCCSGSDKKFHTSVWRLRERDFLNVEGLRQPAEFCAAQK
ncbi:MAG: ChbG/HpnK family deacetylase [Planctomycetaceae bacterium]|jgi:predicted glycoside hydrolase/deacetylase ChbG (UPF0249 family)|nr:ChbG/HpnK family deacetylase [Planctomycetaceae bacterium]